jgi:hypothetical protein
VQVQCDLFTGLFEEQHMAWFVPALRLLLIASLFTLTTSRLAAAQSAGQITTYRGACDGSAAVALDQERFAVADDDSNFLNIYQIGKPDAVGLNLDQFLEAPKKKSRYRGGGAHR